SSSPVRRRSSVCTPSAGLPCLSSCGIDASWAGAAVREGRRHLASAADDLLLLDPVSGETTVLVVARRLLALAGQEVLLDLIEDAQDRKSTRLNSSHVSTSY